MSPQQTDTLKGVEVFVFDVFGTVVDWYTNITQALAQAAPHGVTEDWDAFANEWRTSYFQHARHVAAGGEGPTNMDVVHRQCLDALLETSRWKHLASVWGDETRQELVMAWHKASGWSDSSKGIYALKKKAIVAALSNGNLRFLVDLAKNSDLPFDALLSVDMFGTCKPNPKVYQGALYHLSVAPDKCVMVAAHLWDLRAAASQGMKTVYIPRPTDDLEDKDSVKSKVDGGEVDLIVHSIEDLAALI